MEGDEQHVPAVDVAKYGDRIRVSLNKRESVDHQIVRLCEEHGTGAVFVDGVSVASLRAKQDEEVETESPQILIGSNRHDAEIEIGSMRVSLGEIVHRAFTRSGKTAGEWNDMPDIERELLIDSEINLMQLEAKGGVL